MLLSCRLLSETLELSNKQDRRAACLPWSSAHYKSSFMLGQSGSVTVEAGVVAGQRKPLSGFAFTAAHLLMTGLWEAGPLCTLL